MAELTTLGEKKRGKGGEATGMMSTYLGGEADGLNESAGEKDPYEES